MRDQRACVFLVDDNIVNLNAGKTALQQQYTVITIPSGEKLLLSIQKIKPNLILLDIDMPHMSGYDALKALKLNPETADIPVIFLTGKNEPEDEVLGLSLGAVDYITKPFSPSILLKRVELHLLLQAQKNELHEFNRNLLDMVEERTKDISDLQNAVIVWAAEIIEFRDEETGQHVERVQKYLKELLCALGKPEPYAGEISTWDIDAFLKSASLHDVGKIKIRDDILLKKTSLSSKEFFDMQLHTLHGKTLLESLQSKVPKQIFLEYAKTLAYRHHERWDGTGYPDQLTGEEIPLQARMMALVDVYDALISERPYKKAFSHEEAMRTIIEGQGTQFDPNLVDVFISVSDKIREIGEGIHDAPACCCKQERRKKDHGRYACKPA